SNPRFPPGRGEKRGAHTQRLLKAPREALDGIEDLPRSTWQCHKICRLRMARNSPRILVPTMPKKRGKFPGFIVEGQGGEMGRCHKLSLQSFSKRNIWSNPGDGNPFS
ncbi:hypothetical protein H1C71_017598, partial [Ictidomys tridecemlineatus]